MPVYITAVLKSKPEHTEALKTLLQNLVTESRKEKACLKYDLHQGIEQPEIFTFYEIWESSEGIALHGQQPHIQTFAAAAPGLLQQPMEVYLTQLL